MGRGNKKQMNKGVLLLLIQFSIGILFFLFFRSTSTPTSTSIEDNFEIFERKDSPPSKSLLKYKITEVNLSGVHLKVGVTIQNEKKDIICSSRSSLTNVRRFPGIQYTEISSNFFSCDKGEILLNISSNSTFTGIIQLTFQSQSYQISSSCEIAFNQLETSEIMCKAERVTYKYFTTVFDLSKRMNVDIESELFIDYYFIISNFSMCEEVFFIDFIISY